MDQKIELKLQAFLDGELGEEEAREIANLIAQDKDAAALVGELRHTRQALAGFERVTVLPESREFYWSKIQKEIERLEPAADVAPARGSFFAGLQRWLVPVSAAALFMVTALTVVQSERAPGSEGAAELEITSQHMGAQTFRSQTEGLKMVWLYDRDSSQFTEEPLPDNVDAE